MLNTTLFSKLSKLGYSDEWLDKGLLTENDLHQQLERFHAREDENLEHYRYATLIQFIDSRESISDKDLNNYLHIIGNERDILIAGSATAKLLEKDYLNTEQFEKVSKRLTGFGEWTEKVIFRQVLLRKLKTSTMTQELFEEILTKGDSVVHAVLLQAVDNDKDKLQRLAEKGANNKIKNQASQLLRRKNYR
jgi:hypothetical protein